MDNNTRKALELLANCRKDCGEDGHSTDISMLHEAWLLARAALASPPPSQPVADGCAAYDLCTALRLAATPSRSPADLSKSDADYWLRHRAAIIDAIEAAGFTLVGSHTKGFRLHPADGAREADAQVSDEPKAVMGGKPYFGPVSTTMGGEWTLPSLTNRYCYDDEGTALYTEQHMRAYAIAALEAHEAAQAQPAAHSGERDAP